MSTLPEPLRRLVHDADRPLFAAAQLGRYALYRELHRHAAALAPTDSFYVGFAAGEGRIVYPYNWDGLAYDDPNANAYAADGLTARILAGKGPYRAGDDGGKLLHRGRRFGDTRRRSEDAIAVAWPGDDGKPIGVVSQLSYTAGVYDADIAAALTALVGIAAAAQRREREDQERRRAWGGGEAADPIGAGIAHVRTLAAELERGLGGHPLASTARRLREACERLQTEAFAQSSRTVDLGRLTAREREIAHALAEGLTNRQIAERLGVSDLTVKTHVAAVLRKLSVTGRSAVSVLLKGTPME